MAYSENILPKSVANNLKCAECKQYLSVPPITYTVHGTNCGRCLPDVSHKSAAQAHYETLAQIIKFPCRYDSHGCTEYFHMNEMKNHESQCKFKTVQCPIKHCRNNIKLRNVLQHFQQQHKNLTSSSTVVSLPEEKNVFHHKLLTLHDTFFLLEIIILDEKCWLTLMYFEEKPESYELYQLEIKSSENSNVILLNQRRIIKYASEVDHEEEEKNVVNIDVLKTALNSQKFEIEIKFINAVDKAESNNSDLLQELECVVCSEYMVPPIYICKTGHSVCSTCKDKIQICPTCRAGYEGARNFALEKLSKHIPYACKNKSEEVKCAAKLVECPLSKQEKCHWTGAPNEIYKHARRFHAHRSWIRLGQDMFRNLKTASTQECHVVTHDEEIFKVFMKHDNFNSLMHLHVEHFLFSQEKSKYRFTLQFVDQTNTGRVLIIKEACHGSEDYSHLTLPYNLLKSFMQNEKVIFRLSIEKISNSDLTHT